MDQAQDVKEKIDIVEFINSRIPLKKAGRNFKVNCPFHQEKTPSFVVNPERQIWYCFGACSQGGDVISFLQKYENLEFYEALRALADEAGVKLAARNFSDSKHQLKDKLYRINHLACEYYHYLLKEHKVGETARKYLKERKIKDKIVNTFQLGYAPNSWDGLIKFLNKKKISPELIESAGLAIKSTRQKGYYDRFRARIIFPLLDHRKNIAGFSGRLIDKKAQQAKYINTPETVIYHKRKLLYGLAQTGNAIKREDSVIIAEGEFDVLSSFQAGVANIVAVKGSGLSEDQLYVLKRFTQKIIFALDADKAGKDAVKRGVLLADDKGFDIKIIPIEQGNDPDEIIRKTPLLWKKAVKKPVNYFDYIIDSVIDSVGIKDSFSKRKIINQLAAFFSRSTNQIVRAHYAKKVADKIDLPEEIVFDEIEKEERKIPIEKSKYKAQKQIKEETEIKARWQILEEYILSLILHTENPDNNIKVLESILPIEKMPKSAAARILSKLKAEVEKGSKAKIAEFIQKLEKELIPVADKAYLTDISGPKKEEKNIKSELKNATSQLKQYLIQEELKKQTAKLKKIKETDKENSQLHKLNEIIKKLKRQILML